MAGLIPGDEEGTFRRCRIRPGERWDLFLLSRVRQVREQHIEAVITQLDSSNERGGIVWGNAYGMVVRIRVWRAHVKYPYSALPGKCRANRTREEVESETKRRFARGRSHHH